MHISCTICTELYEANEETGITKCGHLFHMNCIQPWLQKHKTCPHCRASTSVSDLIRVFFTEISSENVHLNRNCKIDSLEAIAASEKEHIKKIQIDLQQSKNDLIDMNKHIERYENEIKYLKILNESLSENNLKLEFDNKNLIEQITITEIKSNSSDLDNYKNVGINLNENENDIIELKTIIESYEEANNRSIVEIELLQKQLNIELLQKEILMTRNGQLEHELKNLNEEIRKYQMSFTKTKCDERKENVNVITRKELRNDLDVLNIKKCGKRHDSKPLEILRQEEILTKSSKSITKIGNSVSELATPNMTNYKSFQKASERNAKLKLLLSDIDISQQPELRDAIPRSRKCKKKYQNLEVLKVNTLKGDEHNEPINIENKKFEGIAARIKNNEQNINNNNIIERESPTLKYTSNESFQKTREKFTSLDRSDKHLNDTPTVDDLKEHKHKRLPIRPPRTLKLFPLTIRTPSPPPRTRTDKTTKLESNINLRIPQCTPRIETRTPVLHPLTIDRIIKRPPAGSIPLLGLCQLEYKQFVTSPVFDNDTFVSEEENVFSKDEEETKVNLNESNA